MIEEKNVKSNIESLAYVTIVIIVFRSKIHL